MPINDSRYHLMVDKHEQDLYRGNGKPGLTTRMAGAEGRLDNHDTLMAKLERQGGRMIALLISTLVSILTLLIVELVKGK